MAHVFTYSHLKQDISIQELSINYILTSFNLRKSSGTLFDKLLFQYNVEHATVP